jgi:hypothetical protein
MAFDAKGICRMSIGGAVGTGPTSVKSIYHYGTNDTAAQVETAGYFSTWVSQLVVGDIIFASLDLDGTPAFKSYMVTANSGTAVTIAAQTVA